jgi:hypothetical protein
MILCNRLERNPNPIFSIESLTHMNTRVITTVVGSLFLPEIIPAAVGLVPSQTLGNYIFYCVFLLIITLMTFQWIYHAHRYLRSHLFFSMIIPQMCFVLCWIHRIPANFTFTNMLPLFTFLTDWLFGIWNFISRDLRGYLSTTYKTRRISGFLVHRGLLIINESI